MHSPSREDLVNVFHKVPKLEVPVIILKRCKSLKLHKGEIPAVNTLNDQEENIYV